MLTLTRYRLHTAGDRRGLAGSDLGAQRPGRLGGGKMNRFGLGAGRGRLHCSLRWEQLPQRRPPGLCRSRSSSRSPWGPIYGRSVMKKYLAAVAVFTLAAGSAGLAAPGALAATQSAGLALGQVAGTSGYTGVRASLAPPPAASGPGWSMVPSANPRARTGQLAGVSCSSSSSCTAVGGYTKRFGTTVTLAERWNGASWSVESTPSPQGGASSALNAVDCTSASVCVAVGNSFTHSGTEITLAERWDGTRWSIQATPNPSSGGGALFGVSCTSASACTAVGASNAGTFAEQWNGTKWAIQPTPNPAGAQFSFLIAVTCTSSSACTAVGGYGNSSGTQVTLAEHWNGTQWRIQATSNPSGAQFSFLNAVSCTSPSACTAVGGYGNSSGTLVTLAERWNGTTWVIQHTPNPSGAQVSILNAVSCTSSSACAAFGFDVNGSGLSVTLAERWNGTTWSIQPTPNRPRASASGFSAVSCPMPSFCMAAGTAANSFSTPVSLAESWNGKSWKVQNTPNLPGAEPSGLLGVSCTRPSNCMAVGLTGTDFSPRAALVAEHWNGNSWNITPVPNPPGMTAGGGLGSVSCTATSACMAIGAYSNSSSPFQPLSERWNGTRWSVVPIPHPPGALATLLQSVACTSATACTTVGFAINASGTAVTVAERWNGTRWSNQPTPNPAGVPGVRLAGVACTSPSACTAVGGSFANTSLTERWNGTKWAILASPNPPGPIYDLMLWSVACSRPLHCMAVGKYAAFPPQLTLAEQWNGSRGHAQSAAKVSEIPTASGLACLGVQRLIIKGLGAATSTAARFGVGRGPSTRPAWMAFLPQCRGT